MNKLDLIDINKIIIHTAAAEKATTVDDIKQWHLDKGWSDIGYHFVITGSNYDLEKGRIYKGRDLWKKGAHAKFCNNSIGICLTGHGDLYPFTKRQEHLLSGLLQMILKEYPYQFSIDQIIGHRDTWWEKLKRNKTCPGTTNSILDVKRNLVLTNMTDFDPIEEAKIKKWLPKAEKWIGLK